MLGKLGSHRLSQIPMFAPARIASPPLVSSFPDLARHQQGCRCCLDLHRQVLSFGVPGYSQSGGTPIPRLYLTKTVTLPVDVPVPEVTRITLAPESAPEGIRTLS